MEVSLEHMAQHQRNLSFVLPRTCFATVFQLHYNRHPPSAHDHLFRCFLTLLLPDRKHGRTASFASSACVTHVSRPFSPSLFPFALRRIHAATSTSRLGFVCVCVCGNGCEAKEATATQQNNDPSKPGLRKLAKSRPALVLDSCCCLRACDRMTVHEGTAGTETSAPQLPFPFVIRASWARADQLPSSSSRRMAGHQLGDVSLPLTVRVALRDI